MQKKNRKNRMSYEPEADVLRIESSRKAIDHAVEIDNTVVHFSADGSPVYVEILEASRFLRQDSGLLLSPTKRSIFVA